MPKPSIRFRATLLDYSSMVRANLSVPGNYWLYNSDINASLRESLQLNKTGKVQSSTQNDVYVTQAVFGRKNSPLDNELKIAMDKIKKAQGNEVPYEIYLPVNPNGRHWAYVQVRVDEQGQVSAIYKDFSKYSEAEKRMIEDNLKKGLGDDVKFTSEYGTQTDDWTCGYRVIQGIISNFNSNDPISKIRLDSENGRNELRESVFRRIDKANHLPLLSERERYFKKQSDMYQKVGVQISTDEDGILLTAKSNEDKDLDNLVKSTLDLMHKLGIDENRVPMEIEADELTMKKIREIAQKYNLGIVEKISQDPKSAQIKMNIEGDPRPAGAPAVPAVQGEMNNERRHKIEECSRLLHLNVSFDENNCSIFKKGNEIAFVGTSSELRSCTLMKNGEDAERMIKLTQASFGNNIVLYSESEEQRELIQEAYLSLKKNEPNLVCRIVTSKEEYQTSKEQDASPQANQTPGVSQRFGN